MNKLLKYRYEIGRCVAIAIVMVWSSLYGSAQDIEKSEKNEKVKSMYMTIGSSNELDTYLSPYCYKGKRVGFTYERIGKHVFFDGSLAVAWMNNPAGNVKEYGGDLRWRYAYMYDVLKMKNFMVKVGPMGVLNTGVLYNERNGNNPAQAKVSLMADFSALIQYKLHVGRMAFPLRYHVDVPFVGVAFSPNYGQSYYEIFILNNTDHNAVFAYFGNTPSLRHKFTVDVPVADRYITLGYMGVYDQSLYNHLRYHNYSHNFIIGFCL